MTRRKKPKYRGTEVRRKSAQVAVRFTPEEHEQVRLVAYEHGISKGEVLRRGFRNTFGDNGPPPAVPRPSSYPDDEWNRGSGHQ